MQYHLSDFPVWKKTSALPADLSEGFVLLVDKPLGWTSFDVVRRLRNLLSKHLHEKKLKVGHAGTLDPLATGLMIVCVGKATKIITEMTAFDKEYVAQMELGRTTPSFDQETKTDGVYPTAHITRGSVEEAAGGFIGDTMQVPPLFSAKKIEGVRAYEFARQGDDRTLDAQPIHISAMDVLDFEMPYVNLRIRCSKGTYIRALVRDLGRALQTGACMTALRRTGIGPFLTDEALLMDDLCRQITTIV